MKVDEMAAEYTNDRVEKKGQYQDYRFDVRKELTVFDGYEIEQAYEDGAIGMAEEVLMWLEKAAIKKYISSITSGVGVITFNKEEFINDLKKEVGYEQGRGIHQKKDG